MVCPAPTTLSSIHRQDTVGEPTERFDQMSYCLSVTAKASPHHIFKVWKSNRANEGIWTAFNWGGMGSH